MLLRLTPVIHPYHRVLRLLPHLSHPRPPNRLPLGLPLTILLSSTLHLSRSPLLTLRRFLPLSSAQGVVAPVSPQIV